MSVSDDTLQLPPDTGPRRPDTLDLARPHPELDRALVGESSGRFTSGPSLGTGGQAEVRAVHDRLLERRRAAKHAHRGPDASRRLLAEARVMGALSHPGVVPVHDFGRTGDGRAWLLMERVDGTDLKDWITDRGPVAAHDGSLLRLLDALAAVCDTLSLAHDRGWLHRDVKPANVMLGDYGRVVLVDWGLALPHDR